MIDEPSVTLPGIRELDLSSASAANIMATFKDDSLPDGDYRLTVTSGIDVGMSATFVLTVGA